MHLGAGTCVMLHHMADSPAAASGLGHQALRAHPVLRCGAREQLQSVTAAGGRALQHALPWLLRRGCPADALLHAQLGGGDWPALPDRFAVRPKGQRARQDILMQRTLGEGAASLHTQARWLCSTVPAGQGRARHVQLQHLQPCTAAHSPEACSQWQRTGI